MKADTLRLLFTYTTALVVIAGGFYIIYQSRLDASETVANLQLMMAGFIGLALQFVFSADQSTRTARQTERNYAAASQATISAAISPAFTGGQAPPAEQGVTP